VNTTYLDTDVAERPPQSWDKPATASQSVYVDYSWSDTDPFKSRFHLFDEDHREVDSERVNRILDEDLASAKPVNPYSSLTLNFIRWGLIAFALAAGAMIVAVGLHMPAIAAVSLLSLFLSMTLIGEAQRRAKLERSSRETGRAVAAH
jgi:hypothetical protein